MAERAAALCACAGMAALALAACKPASHMPDPAALALITATLDSQLNDAPTRLQLNLINADRDHRVHAYEVVLPGNGRTIPADWWVWRRGWLKYAGVDDYNSGYFVLTAPGQAFAKGARPVWLRSAFKAPPQVSCAGGGSWTSCKVTGVAVVRPTAEGARQLEPAALPEFGLESELDYGPQGWEVRAFQITSGGSPSELSRTTMLGDGDHISKAHWSFAIEANRLVR